MPMGMDDMTNAGGTGGKGAEAVFRPCPPGPNTRSVREPMWRSVPKGVAFLVVLVVLLTAWVTVASAGSSGKSAPVLSVDPAEAYTGDAIVITLSGLPWGYRLPAGAVTLAGLRLKVPGVFGVSGTEPLAGGDGDLTFTTVVPVEAPFGVQSLVVANTQGEEDHVSTLEVLAANISVLPEAVPNQKVTLRGSGFSASNRPGGKGPAGAHQIRQGSREEKDATKRPAIKIGPHESCHRCFLATPNPRR